MHSRILPALACSLLLMVSLLNAGETAIKCLPGSGASVLHDGTKEFSADYHSSADDYHFYGSNQWAVRFNFADFYPNIANCSFNIRKARLYFPNIAVPVYVNVALYEDAVNSPGTLITQKDSLLTTNWTDFEFTSLNTRTVVWLVVTDSTNIANWVSASEGSGTHSYFMNNAPIPYWQKFSSAGFTAELLAGLVGSFNLGDNPDLELLSFDFSGLLLPRQSVSPAVSIYNHSADTASDVAIDIHISAPDSTLYQPVSLNFPLDLPILSQDSLFFEFPQQIALPETPMQISVTATLQSSFTETDSTLSNNTITKIYNVFNNDAGIHIVENFIRSGTLGSLPTLPDTLTYKHLVYYPNFSDPGSNAGSLARFDWYKLLSLPTTVIGGSKKIRRQPSPSEFLEGCLNTVSRKSFISSSTDTLDTFGQTSGNLRLQVKLHNTSTVLYLDGTNPATNSGFFAGLFQREDISPNEHCYVLQRWIAHAAAIDSTLNVGTSITRTYSFNTSGLDSSNNYVIIYWLQDKTEGQIYYANSVNLPVLPTSGPEPQEPLPAALLSFYPNPVRSGGALQLKNNAIESRVTIYNLRGQKIWSQDKLAGDILLPASIFPASGIYFVRSEALVNGNKSKQTKKLSVIK